MIKLVPPETLRKIRKLAQLPDEARRCEFVALSITRLTVLKSLCQQPEAASRFVMFLAQRIQQKMEERAKRPGSLSLEEWSRHRGMIERAVAALEQHFEKRTEMGRSRLQTLFHELVAEQNEHRRVYGGPVRIIKNNDLLLVEYALRTVLADLPSIPHWAYQTARVYAERYESRFGTGLPPTSAPLLQDIADFWMEEFGITSESINTPAKADKPKQRRSPAMSQEQKIEFTHRQGQFLAFIHWYRKLHRQSPAEMDMVQYFRVTPPTVHGMVVKLEQLGLVTRERGVPRSVRVAIPESEMPELEDVQGPPW